MRPQTGFPRTCSPQRRTSEFSQELEAVACLGQRSATTWLRFLKDYCYTELKSLLKTHAYTHQRISLTGVEKRWAERARTRSQTSSRGVARCREGLGKCRQYLGGSLHMMNEGGREGMSLLNPWGLSCPGVLCLYCAQSCLTLCDPHGL